VSASGVTPAALARLCAAALPNEDLTAGDLEACCFGPGARFVTHPDGVEQGAAAFVLREYPEHRLKMAWLLLVAVAPGAQRRGAGRALVTQVIDECRAEAVFELHTGNAAPRYIWPGVDLSNTAALSLFQTLDFEPYDHGLNMLLPTSFRAPIPPGVTIERETGDGATDFARRELPHWEDEVARGVEQGGTFAARDADGSTIAFACHSVNRHTWIGPMATDPQRRRAGTGHALLAALAEDIAARHGATVAEISWVAPIPFYARAGATAHRAFRMHRYRF
jgi:GNAT superfamily N-acetyltransferase